MASRLVRCLRSPASGCQTGGGTAGGKKAGDKNNKKRKIYPVERRDDGRGDVYGRGKEEDKDKGNSANGGNQIV